MRQSLLTASAVLFSLIFVWNCGPDKETQALIDQSHQTFGVIPEKMPGAENDTPALISLGEKLYHDTRLSINEKQSCNTCHNVKDNGNGTDNLQFSPGAPDGTKGGRNAPTVLNAGFHLAQFWDGRAADLKEQAKGPVLNPVEMAMPDEATVVKRLAADAQYKEAFSKAFPEASDAISYDNMAAAIASFERTLRTTDRFDEFMNGKGGALDANEKAGLKTFMEVGCIQCHNGPLLGGTSYRKMGQINAYKNTADKGRFDVTKNPADLYFFKVPSLRNVALTGPYFHDGSVPELSEAVREMAWLQLGKKLSEQETANIVAFLKSLNGQGLKQ
ncbi:MAG: c-type cytochrome [Leptospiraceae bacterium]|nr:c-type cytochrome [Leptospiraceae bacterium]